MTTDEIAALLRVDVVTIRRLVSRGELSGYRIGSEFRFSQEDLDDFLRRQRLPANEELAGENLNDEATRAKMLKGKRFEKFTQQARQVLNFAYEEAINVQHSYIGPEHLLLGLIREEVGVAAQVFKRMNVEVGQARNLLLSVLAQGDKPANNQPGLTPPARKVVELAVDEAKKLDHHNLSTGHLLLGLIREGEGLGADLLRRMKVSLDAMRSETLSLLAHTTFNDDQETVVPLPPVPQEAQTLVAEEMQGQLCTSCGAQSPAYFRYCFHCGALLIHA